MLALSAADLLCALLWCALRSVKIVCVLLCAVVVVVDDDFLDVVLSCIGTEM